MFLARLVGPDSAMASAHGSLKSISGGSPGIELAARHCFLLEDPPDDKKELVASERYVTSYGAYISLYVPELNLILVRHLLSC